MPQYGHEQYKNWSNWWNIKNMYYKMKTKTALL